MVRKIKSTYISTRMLLALATHEHIWRSAFTQGVDGILKEEGYSLIHLNWAEFETEEGDDDHFTWNGMRVFSKTLSHVLQKSGVKNVRVLSDSTIDHCNWSDGERHGEADAFLSDCLAKQGIRSVIDSVCGSGLTAMREERKDFVTRARRAMKNETLLLIGGWNDQSIPFPSIRRSAASIARMIRVANVANGVGE